VLIDLDRTLFDSDTSETAAFDGALRAAGVADPERHLGTYLEINRRLWAAVERGEIGPAELRVTRFERLGVAIGLDADPLAMADAYVAGLSSSGGLYPGVRGVLERLAGQASLAMITNGFSDVQRARISRLRLERYFSAIVISTEVGAAKPAAGIFDATFRQLGSPAKTSALMVGDSLTSDIGGGASYGIATCWYNPHGQVADRPTPDHEISRFEQLPAVAAGR
jgi:YjjG family noncanonical pyrimidine nucleotidase